MAMTRQNCLLTCTLLAVTFSVSLSKSIERTEAQDDSFQLHNSLQLQSEDAIAMENALVRYLLTKEWLARARPPLAVDIGDLEDQQKKRGYWKQCAFNAVSCFGK